MKQQENKYLIKFFDEEPEDPESEIPSNVIEYYGSFDEAYYFANEYLQTKKGAFFIKHEN